MPDRSTRPAPRTLADLVTVLGLANNVANIIMQLSLPPVGEGVSESRVVSGSPRRYPVKRGRTTGTYLAVALLGSEQDRAAMREAVAQVHHAVVSGPDSPVRYSGNAPDLQLWVAACLFRYYLDQYRLLHGELSEPELDVLTRAAAPLATGLNVRPSQWPGSWAELEAYWTRMLPSLSISAEVHRDFESLADLTFAAEAWGPLGSLLARLLGRRYRFFTAATLPAHFRTLMGWTWTAQDQRRFERSCRWLRRVDRWLNPWSLKLAYAGYLWDFRLRRRLGLPPLGRLRIAQERIRDGGGLRRWGRRPEPGSGAGQ